MPGRRGGLGSPPAHSARWLLGVDAAILVAALAAGWLTAPAGELEWQNLPSTSREAAATALLIARGNLQALGAMLLLGLCTGGVYSLLVLASNCFALGRTLPAVLQTTPSVALFLLTYIPAEFVALLSGCFCVQCVCLSLGRWLVLGERPEMRRSLTAAAVSVGLLLVGAGLEADAGLRMTWLLRK